MSKNVYHHVMQKVKTGEPVNKDISVNDFSSEYCTLYIFRFTKLGHLVPLTTT